MHPRSARIIPPVPPGWTSWEELMDEALAEAGRERETAQLLGEFLAVDAAGDALADQRLRPLDGGRLRAVHDVDRSLMGGDQVADGLVDGVQRP